MERTVAKCDASPIRETFCYKCGHLRLWVQQGLPEACGVCGEPNPVVGMPGATGIAVMAARWHEANVIRELGRVSGHTLQEWLMDARKPLRDIASAEMKRRIIQSAASDLVRYSETPNAG